MSACISSPTSSSMEEPNTMQADNSYHCLTVGNEPITMQADNSYHCLAVGNDSLEQQNNSDVATPRRKLKLSFSDTPNTSQQQLEADDGGGVSPQDDSFSMQELGMPVEFNSPTIDMLHSNLHKNSAGASSGTSSSVLENCLRRNMLTQQHGVSSPAGWSPGLLHSSSPALPRRNKLVRKPLEPLSFNLSSSPFARPLPIKPSAHLEDGSKSVSMPSPSCKNKQSASLSSKVISAAAMDVSMSNDSFVDADSPSPTPIKSQQDNM